MTILSFLCWGSVSSGWVALTKAGVQAGPAPAKSHTLLIIHAFHSGLNITQGSGPRSRQASVEVLALECQQVL